MSSHGAGSQDQSEFIRELVQSIASYWPVEVGGMEPIKVRENAVYAMHLTGGTKLAVRVHRMGYHSDAALQSEHAWMRALRDVGVVAPCALPSKRGSAFEAIPFRRLSGTRQVDIFKWIEGRQLGSVENGLSAGGLSASEVYEKIGELAATIHNQSCQWRLPPGFERHAWNAEGIAGDKPFWGRFWELPALSEQERGLLREVRMRLYADLSALATPASSYSLIHADLVPENILVSGERVQVIDFDDAGFGWHLFELATSLYFVRATPDFDEARDALIRGYRRSRPLSDADAQRLPLFTAARGVTYLGWLNTRWDEPVARKLASQLIELALSAVDDYLTH